MASHRIGLYLIARLHIAFAAANDSSTKIGAVCPPEVEDFPRFGPALSNARRLPKCWAQSAGRPVPVVVPNPAPEERPVRKGANQEHTQ